MNPRNLAPLALAFTLAACGDETSPRPNPTVPGNHTDAGLTGTVNLPVDVTGRCAVLAIDNDPDPSNGVAEKMGAPLAAFHEVMGTSFDFDFSDVPAGSYYIWGMVDGDGSSSSPMFGCQVGGPPDNNDFFAFFGFGAAIPSSANVVVPHAEGTRFDFPLEPL